MEYSVAPPHQGNYLVVEVTMVATYGTMREAMITTSTTVCVNEHISHWYGIGGEWINSGLTMYVIIY